MFFVIDLGEPSDLIQNCLPMLHGPFATETLATEFTEMIDAAGGVSAVCKARIPETNRE